MINCRNALAIAYIALVKVFQSNLLLTIRASHGWVCFSSHFAVRIICQRYSSIPDDLRGPDRAAASAKGWKTERCCGLFSPTLGLRNQLAAKQATVRPTAVRRVLPSNLTFLTNTHRAATVPPVSRQ